MVDKVALIAVVFAAILAAAVLFAFAFAAFRRAEAGLIALVGTFVLLAWFGPTGVPVGSLLVAPYDVLCVFFTLIGIARWANQCLMPAHVAWLCAGALIFISLLLGIKSFGLVAAGAEARGSGVFYFWACVLYFSSFPHSLDAERRWPRVLIWGAIGIAILVFARWGMVFIEGTREFRVAPASEAVFLASAMLLLFRRVLSGGASGWVSGALVVLMLQVLLLQHRSVWLSAFGGVLVLGVLDWPSMKRLIARLPLLVIPVTLGVAVLVVLSALDGLVASLTYSVHNEATLSWRVEGWSDLLTQWLNFSGLEKLLGRPFGLGFRRYLVSLGVEETYSPHNAYLTFLLRIGALGLAAIMITYALSVVNLVALRRRAAKDEHIDCVLSVLTAQLIYFVFYGPDIMLAVFLGAALSRMHAGKRAHEWERSAPVGV